MRLGRVVDRVRYGSVVEKGDFEDHVTEYEDIVRGLNDVDVGVYEWIDPVPDTSSFTSDTRMLTNEAEEQGLSGEEAWDFANEALQDFTPDSDPIDEFPFYFEHRSRSDNHNIRMGASSRTKFSSPNKTVLGSRRDYLVNFNGREQDF